jgi:hypothetical protein
MIQIENHVHYQNLLHGGEYKLTLGSCLKFFLLRTKRGWRLQNIDYEGSRD